MALKETQDDDPLVNQNRHRTPNLLLSIWMATPKPTKTNHVHMMTPPMEKDMKRMIAIPQLMAMIEATIVTITIVTLLLLFESIRLTYMSLRLLLIATTITTIIKLQSPILLLLLVLQHGTPLILRRQLICLIGSMPKAASCQKRGMIRSRTR